MNIGLIFAGGVGSRMNSKSLPKQFLLINGKPIIIHTLEVFQNHPQIDYICVSCVQEYIEHLKSICRSYGISKLKWIVPGGETGQLSIYNGLKAIHDHCPEDSIVLIHDGVRPVITQELLTANIEGVLQHGSAISCARAIETFSQVDDRHQIVNVMPREASVVAKAPQSFYIKDIFAAHQRALAENRHDFIDSASMMLHYGHALYAVDCENSNIKITTPSDFYTLRALLEAKENSQIFGL